MFDELVGGTAGVRGAGAVGAWTRVESAACARKLAAMATMLDAAHAAAGSADRELWLIDNWAAVCADIGAAQRLTPGAALGQLLIAVALRDRLPRVAAVFHDGLITFAVVRAIVARTALVVDPEALAAVDETLAQGLLGWGPMSADRTEKAIDAIIHQIDPDAVKRSQTAARSRSVQVTVDDGGGLAELWATLFAHDAAALDARLDGFAATVERVRWFV